MSQFDRNHDGAALGASHHVPVDEQQNTVYPYTVQGGATIPNGQEMRRRTAMLHTTYLYLAVGVAGCMAGAYTGANSETFLKLMFGSGMLMWIGVMIVLNFVPVIALKVAESAPRLAVPALAADGFISGLVLSPMVYVGLHMAGQGDGAQNVVSTACVVTGAVFAAITAYVHLNKTEFKMGPAVGAGIFGFACVAIPLNMYMQSSIFSLVISGAIGLLGAYQVAKTTSQLVNDPNFNSPARGALMLFAGVFNMFQAILSMLLSGRD